MLSRRGLLGAAGVAVTAPSAAFAENASVPKPPTLEELLHPALAQDAAISPDGTRLAILGTLGKGKEQVAYLGISKVETPKDGFLGKLGDYDVQMVEWGKNDRLLIWLLIWKDARGRPLGIYWDGEFIPIPARRVLAIDPDATKPVFLFQDEKRLLRDSYDAATIVDTLPEDPKRVLMQAFDPVRGVVTLYHVDVYTGEAEPWERGTSLTDGWITQKGSPVLRLDSTFSGSAAMVYGRAPGETKWKLIRKHRRDAFRKLPDFDVVGTTETPGVVLVKAQLDDDRTHVIREFDIRTLEFGKKVAGRDDYDLASAFETEDGSVLGYAYYDDRLNYDFADAKLGRHFRALNVYFKNEGNVRIYDISRDRKTILLYVNGPTLPGSFYVYDAPSARVTEVGPSRPWLTPERLAKMEAFKIVTRDGVRVPCYLTLPIRKGAEPPPLIVMPHGGPEVRDYLNYDLFAQALAAQGWAVLQPNFRGSGGYGKAFADEGRKHWGDRMQEDVEDAVAHVVKEGKVHPKRIGIFGFSYGGYAALMGAVRRPDLYKVVVAGSADADLFELLTFARREEGASSPIYDYWLKTVGDPKTDEAMLKAGSPARRAGEITAPVLLIHGDQDDIVTPKQSKIMSKALKEAGKTYEYIQLKGEGHSNWSSETTKLVLEKSIAFIAKYI